eukprot:g3834.t1
MEDLRDASKVDDDTFKRLLSLSIKQILRTEREKLRSSEMKVPAKNVYAGLSNMLLEAAKTDASAATFSAQLEDSGLSSARVKLVAETFAANKEKFQTLLASIGFKFPKVVGVDWRLDYELRSSTTGKLSSHRYFVKLRTLDSSGNDDDFDFTCSYEQVKDLLAKVEDAKKQLERAMKGMR